MRFDELVATVQGSSPNDWELLSPNRVEFPRVYGVEGAEVLREGHSDVAHLRADLDVSIAWGAPQNNGEPWRGVWSAWSRFPDRTVHGYFAEYRWRGVPVARQLIISADGGRYYLPAPTPRTVGDETKWYTVEAVDVPVARLVHHLTKTESFDEGMRIAGFEVVNG